ncbi:hypothetical protein OF83DRAFT_1055495 [Amylostereum chailletii]|nr:hypothetical protein OF83DRAFT_1055495 [Amylostereum chailletii]
MVERRRYSGPSRRLVLALDLGTTFSGVSYAFLDPGQVSEIRTVTEYIGREGMSESKIPTILHYDERGIARAWVVADAPEEIVETHGELTKVEWYTTISLFKLLLRPSTEPAPQGVQMPSLPKHVSAVFSDFYCSFSTKCSAKKFIQERHASGSSIWNSFKDNIDIVLGHPNGWTLAEQDQMRRAAVDAAIAAGVLQDAPNVGKKVSFVSEGEASFHFCVMSGMARLSDFVRKQRGLWVLRAVFGRHRRRCSSSKDRVKVLTHFRESMSAQPRISLRTFLLTDRHAFSSRPQAYLLVGGFSASPYLFSELKARLGQEGALLFRPDSGGGKAVSDGAVSYHIDHFVTSRAAQFTYGTDCLRLLLPWDHRHMLRMSRGLVCGPNGLPYLPHAFRSIITKGSTVSESKEFVETLGVQAPRVDLLNQIHCDILCYRGDDIPEFMDDNPGLFFTIGKVVADLTNKPKNITEYISPHGRSYELDIGIVLLLGHTELKAIISWTHNVSDLIPMYVEPLLKSTLPWTGY